MALAIATLFFIPPDISDGYLSSESLRSTLFITSLALDIISDSDFEENILKKAFGSFATGVAVATSHKSGFTINSFASLSLKPPLIIFNIYKSETDHVDFLKNNSFVINFLSNEQEEISRLFATKDPEKVSKTSHTISSSNNIILDNTLGHIELSVYQQIDIADHVLVIGKVEDLKIDDNRNPLIYYRSNYQTLKNDN